jgi:hypothetical protein
MKMRHLPFKMLTLHFDLFGVFLGIANTIRPADGKFNYYRALFSISAIDMLCALNIGFSINNLFKLGIDFPALYLAGTAIGIVVTNVLTLGCIENRYHSPSGDYSKAPRVEGYSRWIAISYAAIQVPWLFLNRTWHLMR